MDAYSFFKNLAELSPGKVIQNRKTSLDFDVEVIIGVGEIPIGDKQLIVRIRRAFLSLSIIGGRIEPGSRYAIKLQKFKLHEVEKSSDRESTNTGAKVAARLQAAVSTWVPSLAVHLDAGAELRNSRDQSTLRETTVQSEVTLIGPVPPGRWQLGADAGGDVRKDGGYLHGSYFQESREMGANKYAPLCRIDIGDSKQFSCHVALQAKTSDFHFSIADKWGDAEKASADDKEKFAADMKAAVAGIAAQKSIAARIRKLFSDQGPFNNMPSNEILLAIGVVDNNDVQKSN